MTRFCTHHSLCQNCFCFDKDKFTENTQKILMDKNSINTLNSYTFTSALIPSLTLTFHKKIFK